MGPSPPLHRRAPVAVGVLTVMCVLLPLGCAGWRGVRQPDIAMPDAYLRAHAEGVYVENQWWPTLNDDQLNQYMEEAFANNLTVRQGAARLRQFDAQRKVARASWFPSISAQGTITESDAVEESSESGGTIPGGIDLSELTKPSKYSAGVSAAYELDVWGKLAAGRAAAVADLRASEDDLRAMAISLAAQVARSYYQVVELQQQRALLDHTIASFVDSREIVQARYERGVAPSLDVYQAETTLAGARAQRVLVESSLAQAEHAFAVLLGRAPQNDLVPADTPLPDELAPVPPGLPSELLERRPDVRAAYWRLLAADRRAAEAVAQRFPSFGLTGALNGSSDELSEVIDPEHMVWQAIGNIVLPIFEGGRRKANADRAEAAWDLQLAAYQQVVLQSLREVEDTLVGGRLQQEYLEQLSIQVQAASATLRLATDRYLRGVSDYLPVMSAQTAHLGAQRSRIAARRAQVDLRIGLLTALGGDWTDAVLLDLGEEETKNP